ncbi:hypothetical protein FACS1894184_06230 [Clostridia bacterium]|nr:hypothetical protein FACS1894184_06230 [Clostridia bacterium]
MCFLKRGRKTWNRTEQDKRNERREIAKSLSPSLSGERCVDANRITKFRQSVSEAYRVNGERQSRK